jgi:hypothetical protein
MHPEIVNIGYFLFTRFKPYDLRDGYLFQQNYRSFLPVKVTSILRYTDPMETAKTSPKKPDSETTGSSLSGLKFNSTGREDTTVEVMKTQRDPAAGKKTLAVIAVILFGLAALGALSFQRSGLKIGEIFEQDHGASFGSHETQQTEFK